MRAFDQDERLVGVAFLDVGVYVASLRTVKNLLIIGDVVKSVWFVAFQVSIIRGQQLALLNPLSLGRPIQIIDPWEGPSS